MYTIESVRGLFLTRRVSWSLHILSLDDSFLSILSTGHAWQCPPDHWPWKQHYVFRLLPRLWSWSLFGRLCKFCTNRHGARTLRNRQRQLQTNCPYLFCTLVLTCTLLQYYFTSSDCNTLFLWNLHLDLTFSEARNPSSPPPPCPFPPQQTHTQASVSGLEMTGRC